MRTIPIFISLLLLAGCSEQAGQPAELNQEITGMELQRAKADTVYLVRQSMVGPPARVSLRDTFVLIMRDFDTTAKTVARAPLWHFMNPAAYNPFDSGRTARAATIWDRMEPVARKPDSSGHPPVANADTFVISYRPYRRPL